MNAASPGQQVRLTRITPSLCRVVLDSPPVNVMGPQLVLQMRDVMTALENGDASITHVSSSRLFAFVAEQAFHRSLAGSRPASSESVRPLGST